MLHQQEDEEEEDERGGLREALTKSEAVGEREEQLNSNAAGPFSTSSSLSTSTHRPLMIP